jgi:hypothetical protein
VDPLPVCEEAGRLGAADLLPELWELPPHALSSSDAATADGMRNLLTERTV